MQERDEAMEQMLTAEKKAASEKQKAEVVEPKASGWVRCATCLKRKLRWRLKDGVCYDCLRAKGEQRPLLGPTKRAETVLASDVDDAALEDLDVVGVRLPAREQVDEVG